MAIQWSVSRQVLNEDTQLSKVRAERTDTETGVVRIFTIKAEMKTKAQQDKMWDNIFAQASKTISVDTIAEEGVAALQAKEML